MQSTIETAVAQVVGTHVPVVGSGRTDAGAHALNQVIAFSTDTRLSCETLGRALNAHLPDDIAVTNVREVPDAFNPRKDALSRTYRYHIWNRPTRSPFVKHRATHLARPLDERAMHTAAQSLLGRHDFSSFIPVQTTGSRERTMFDAHCWRDGNMVLVQLEATGFMRQLVRSIVGTLIRVGLGRLTPKDVATILVARDRSLAGDTAPAHGLYLIRVRYPDFTLGTNESFLPAVPHAVAGPQRSSEEKS